MLKIIFAYFNCVKYYLTFQRSNTGTIFRKYQYLWQQMKLKYLCLTLLFVRFTFAPCLAKNIPALELPHWAQRCKRQSPEMETIQPNQQLHVPTFKKLRHAYRSVYYKRWIPVSGSTASGEAPVLISCAAKLKGPYTCSDDPPSSSP